MNRKMNHTDAAPQGAGTPRPGRTGAGRLLMAAAAALFVVTGCDFLDPTDVENPRTTAEDLARSANPTQAFIPGLRAQFARTIAANVTASEVISDNYSIHGTGLDSVLDEPTSMAPVILNATGTSATGGYWNLQELRALAQFVWDDIIPGDQTATPAQRAEVLYYLGMAHVILGENFSHAPLERDGAPVAAADLLQIGVGHLNSSIGEGAGDFVLASRAGLARAHRLLGDAGAATTAATQALAADPTFVIVREYDETTVTNTPYFFLVERQLKEMQPLPRLDFLDPKYISRTSGIPVAKAEEMHLILAEAAMAAGQYATGRDHLVDALQVALARPTITFSDGDPRFNANLTPRPRSAEILVRADPDSPFRAGLVPNRPGSVEFSPISGTSLDPDSIALIPATEEEDLLHALHLARQEIFLLEGRRMSDLGIRLPIMLREIDQNNSMNLGDPGTSVIVPTYIPPQNQMDLFTPASPYEEVTPDVWVLVETEITILHDLNRIMAQLGINAFN
jgi:hypothetical protein